VIPYAEFNTFLLVILLIAGLALLCFGGDWLARGAASLALNLNINPIVVGLTIVAVATSMPELIAGFFAAAQGLDGLVVGNVVGSNLGNMGLILGAAALIYPIRIQRRLLRQELPILLVVTVLFSFMGLSLRGGPGVLDRLDSVLLLSGVVAYVGFILHQVLRNRSQQPAEDEIAEEIVNPIRSQWVCAGWVLAGAIALAAGADFLVGSASQLASRMGVSEGLIGLTIVAVGTSLPELAASFAAAVRKQSDIIAGNIIGSNIFNMLLIGGGVSIVFPIQVDPRFYRIEYPCMLLLTILLWITCCTGRKVTRVEGGVLVVVYAVVILLATLSQTGKLF